MSQNPVLPEENNEEIKTPKPRRTRKTAAENAQEGAEEKKPARRSRKKASAEAGEDASAEKTEEKKPRRRTVKKAGSADESAEAEIKPIDFEIDIVE